MADDKAKSGESGDVLGRLEQFFKGLSLRQRVLLGAGVVVVGATLWGFVEKYSASSFARWGDVAGPG
jgi:hypothetical protein